MLVKKIEFKNKIIFVFGAIALIFIILILISNTIHHYKMSVKSQEEKAWLLGRLVSKMLKLPMISGKMDMVQNMLVSLGEMQGLKQVYVTDSDAIVRYSSIPSQINTRIGSQFALKSLREKNPISGFEWKDDDYIYTLALPIKNELACHSCHDKNKDILGLLRISIDWVPIQDVIQRQFQKDLIMAIVFYLTLLVFSFFFQKLYNNTQEAYKGLKQTQEQLIRSEKMAAIGQMAAAIGHDLRNPLTGIKMAAYYLGSKVDNSNPEVSNILKDIELEVEYASNVVTNILAFARPTDLIYTHVEINNLIEETIPFIHLQDRESNIELVKNLGDDIPRIYVDAKQIKQVLVNLFCNAVQAMPKGGKLTISTRVAEKEVEVTVKDNGIGIAKKDLDRIFIPFFTTKAKGVGLGLSIVENIVKKHNGTMRVRSELGGGTTFIIRIPFKKSAERKNE